MATAESNEKRSPLERVLSVVTDVKAGEGLTALLLMLNVFLLLTAYYVIKPVREGLILAMEGGAEKKSYASGAIAIALLVAVPAYASVANRVSKHKLVVGVTLFFASHLVVFWMLSRIPAVEKHLGLVFFTWVGVFNMMVVAQFWAFANDTYTQEQGKRLFAILGLGASLGGVVGSWLTDFLNEHFKSGVYELLLGAGVLLVGSAFLTHVVHQRESKRTAHEGDDAEKKEDKKDDEPAKAEKGSNGAFGMVIRHRYLLLLALFSLIFTLVNSNGEYILSTLAKERAAARAVTEGIPAEEVNKFMKTFVAGYYGSFFLWVNIIGLVVQTFLVSRIVKLGGLKLAFFIFPVVVLISSGALVLLPSAFGLDKLSVFRPGKTAENATDYSVNNTVRNMLWLPTTTEMKYKAKQAVDTFFVRMGDVASAGAVFLFGATLKWPITSFSLVNIVLVGIWLALAVGIVRENTRLTEKKKEREGDAPASEKVAS